MREAPSSLSPQPQQQLLAHQRQQLERLQLPFRVAFWLCLLSIMFTSRKDAFCNDPSVVFMVGDSLIRKQFEYMCWRKGSSDIVETPCMGQLCTSKMITFKSCTVGHNMFVYSNNYVYGVDMVASRFLPSLIETYGKQPTHLYIDSNYHLLWKLSPEWNQTAWDGHLLIPNDELQWKIRLQFLNFDTYRHWKTSEQRLEQFIQQLPENLPVIWMTPHWMCEHKYFQSQYVKYIISQGLCWKPFKEKYPEESAEQIKAYCHDGGFNNPGIAALQARQEALFPASWQVVDGWEITKHQCDETEDGRHYSEEIRRIEVTKLLNIITPGCPTPYDK